MVRQLNSRRSQVKNGGRSAQSQQDPGHRHPQQLQRVRASLGLPRGLAYEPRTQVRVVVTLWFSSRITKDSVRLPKVTALGLTYNFYTVMHSGCWAMEVLLLTKAFWPRILEWRSVLITTWVTFEWYSHWGVITGQLHVELSFMWHDWHLAGNKNEY